MVLMTTKEIPYRLNPIGMVSSFARRQVASPFFTDCSVPTFLISLFPFYSPYVMNVDVSCRYPDFRPVLFSCAKLRRTNAIQVSLRYPK